MNNSIAGWGTALPRHSISQRDAAEIVKTICCETPEQERLLTALYRRTGVKTRHSVLLNTAEGSLDHRQSFFPPATTAEDRGPTTAQRMQRYAEESPRLGVEASQMALERADVPANRISHVVTVSCSGFDAPGIDVALIERLGLSPSVARTNVGYMGCHGALNGLRVADAFVRSQPRAAVLLCAVELCSLHHQYGWDPEQIVANALFADGAAAVVVTRHADRDDDHWRLAAFGSRLFDDSADLMTWRIGDHGFEMTLDARVPDVIAQSVRPWLKSWLAEHEMTIEDVGSWAVHPGGPRILNAFGEGTGLDREALAPSFDVLARCGNMSSPTVLFILEQLQRERAPRPCVALGFGPGLAVEAALFR